MRRDHAIEAVVLLMFLAALVAMRCGPVEP